MRGLLRISKQFKEILERGRGKGEKRSVVMIIMEGMIKKGGGEVMASIIHTLVIEKYEAVSGRMRMMMEWLLSIYPRCLSV